MGGEKRCAVCLSRRGTLLGARRVARGAWRCGCVDASVATRSLARGWAAERCCCVRGRTCVPFLGVARKRCSAFQPSACFRVWVTDRWHCVSAPMPNASRTCGPQPEERLTGRCRDVETTSKCLPLTGVFLHCRRVAVRRAALSRCALPPPCPSLRRRATPWRCSCPRCWPPAPRRAAGRSRWQGSWARRRGTCSARSAHPGTRLGAGREERLHRGRRLARGLPACGPAGRGKAQLRAQHEAPRKAPRRLLSGGLAMRRAIGFGGECVRVGWWRMCLSSRRRPNWSAWRRLTPMPTRGSIHSMLCRGWRPGTPLGGAGS